MPKDSPPSVPASKAVLAAGAVLWRPGDDGSDATRSRSSTDRATTTGRCPRARSTPARPNRSPRCARSTRRPATRRTSAGGWRRSAIRSTQGIKKVRYWAARARRRRVHPERRSRRADLAARRRRDEAAAVSARPKVLRRFAKQPADTTTVLIVRHGTAGSKSRYKGDDRKRPLDKRGRAQAESLVGQLLAFGADDALRRRPRTRCHQTLEPLAEELGVDDPRRAAADRGGLRRRPQGRPAPRPRDRRRPTARR